MKRCHSCKAVLELDRRPARADTCTKCLADLKCCKNCKFYDTNSYNECRETQAERVVIKDRSNFCDYFQFRDDEESSEDLVGPDPMAGLKDLFGGD